MAPCGDEWLACQAIAVAIWLVPASVQIVGWPAEGPVRLAFLAPAWKLGILCAGALVVAMIAARGGRRAASVLAPFLQQCGRRFRKEGPGFRNERD